MDIGSGAGEVAFRAADIIGGTREVIGTDKSPIAVAAARASAADGSLGNVSLREGDPADMTFERPFDAVIGRYVLKFQTDPVLLLRKCAAHLRPGDLIVFHEIDWDGVRSLPVVPTHDRCCRWIVETLRLSGAEPRMGMKLLCWLHVTSAPSFATCSGGIPEQHDIISNT